MICIMFPLYHVLERPYLWVGAVSRLRITLSISSSTSSKGLLELCSAECWLAWYSNRSEDNELTAVFVEKMKRVLRKYHSPSPKTE